MLRGYPPYDWESTAAPVDCTRLVKRIKDNDPFGALEDWEEEYADRCLLVATQHREEHCVPYMIRCVSHVTHSVPHVTRDHRIVSARYVGPNVNCPIAMCFRVQ